MHDRFVLITGCFGGPAIETALADRAAAERLDGWMFFDRGLIDAASAL